MAKMAKDREAVRAQQQRDLELRLNESEEARAEGDTVISALQQQIVMLQAVMKVSSRSQPTK
jgi:uncharacterized coiled-coil protein SlyX